LWYYGVVALPKKPVISNYGLFRMNVEWFLPKKRVIVGILVLWFYGVVVLPKETRKINNYSHRIEWWWGG
jgi:hypothetical protein